MGIDKLITTQPKANEMNLNTITLQALMSTTSYLVDDWGNPFYFQEYADWIVLEDKNDVIIWADGKPETDIQVVKMPLADNNQVIIDGKAYTPYISTVVNLTGE